MVRESRWFAPGRIEVLGKHVDYAGGRSLLCAVDRGFIVSARAADEITVTAPDGQSIVFDGPLCPPCPPFRPGHWSVYAAAVVRRLRANFGVTGGAAASFESDLPPAAGLSSSSALVVGLFMALADVFDLPSTETWKRHLSTRQQLAGYLGAVENGLSFGPFPGETGVGTAGGSQDHTAIVCSEPGKLVQYAFAPVRYEGDVRFPDDHRFVIGVSGVVAAKSGAALAAYNGVSAAASRLIRTWNDATGRSDTALGDVEDVDRFRSLVTDPALSVRLEQFYAETRRIVPVARSALAARDWAAFGDSIDESQRLAEAALGNQIPETIHLARSARRLGAVAASAFGAGFGGSVYAVVKAVDADDFVKAWEGDYHESFDHRSTFFVTTPGPAAKRVG